MGKLHILLSGLIVFLTFAVQANVRLPKLVSNGMVLQQNAEVKIWGWAEKNEKIHVSFIDEDYQTTANEAGEWEIILKDLPLGGPYQMTINAGNTIKIDDILVGDVWLCSGQSNMDYRMSAAKSIYGDEIAQSKNSEIRCFTVPVVYDFSGPQKDLESGEWLSADPETVLDFSAVSYFFAATLYEKYKVPLGLILASKGGSPAQAWISKEAIKKFPDYYAEAVKYEDKVLIEKTIREEKLRQENWFKTANASDEGHHSEKSWFEPSTNTSDWESMNIPGWIAREPIGNVKGVFWFKKEIDIPAGMTGKEAVFKMGAMVNADSVFINGVFIGTTSHQWSPRAYKIPPGLLKAGKNTIVLRLINHNGYGGFYEGYKYQIEIGEQKLDISGEWKYKLGTRMEELPWATGFDWKATSLYNGMFSPVSNYKIKGAIWYQGEGNAGKAIEYDSLFPCLIKDWRNTKQQGDFPFLFVQLANFMKTTDKPTSSNWARLRESQRKALRLPNTGMAVAIDVGVAHNVHPMNKKDVGYRLALEAQRVAYGDNKVVSAGPLYKSHKIKGNKIVLSFKTYGSNLKIKNGDKLEYFAIAGADKNFVSGDARIKKDKIIVSSPDIENPIAVRYAWADNPETANLVNTEGLPASPFRSDDWD
jgi:sialate O-acetylesterase